MHKNFSTLQLLGLELALVTGRVTAISAVSRRSLVIYQLQGLEYVMQTACRYFPDMNLPGIIAQCVQGAYERHTSTALRELKHRLG